MSSRALRKAQRELEEKKQLEQPKADANSEDESEDGTDAPALTSQGPSMFALLGDADDQNDEEPDEQARDATTPDYSDEQQTPQPVKAKKKKKKKGKRQKTTEDVDTNRAGEALSEKVLDEIDLALRALSVKDSKARGNGLLDLQPTISPEQHELCKLLAVETQHLHAANEMRKLFGRAALEANEDEDGHGQRRRRMQRGNERAGAVAGRNAGGRNLAAIGLRKNIFVQGKEEWPRATLGGLGMEIIEKRKDGTVLYKFVHNSAYQDVQRQFNECVASMDPNRMVQLLQYNPSHISTLLQVSEIAKHERDRATSGDLLERALFSFGKAVHSTFPMNLAQGKARLDFKRPENREFWLAGWRYIAILGQKATWRTAFEWALLLLSLDPLGDPYCVSLVIDQLAIRSRQPQRLIDLWDSEYLSSKWHRLANISMSVGLAYVQVKEPALGRTVLKKAIEQYPWVAMRLFQELDLQPIPGSIWGKQVRSEVENIFTELYVKKSKDIWNTPEATTILMEVASSAQPNPSPDMSIYTGFDELDYTRHIMLTDDQSLIGLLDRRLTSSLTSVSDPLPPRDNISSYSAARQGRASGSRASALEIVRELSALETFFRNLLPFFPQAGQERAQGASAFIDPDTGEVPTPQDLEQRIMASGIELDVILARSTRMQELQRELDIVLRETDSEENIEALRLWNEHNTAGET
ncbi:DUF654-domain-containing protein [Pseudovirgaria hyperparasitica]|uniref:DUF654-domain-containing protein n=1 Tax=Pseudovirgaria hyperparasitica TaxID=470096 RepID=A0A6A6WBY3_9PEZI|nr:DUF654-domain-containing protein [Pseudovirgaria hyperparasitica]KAF2759470.1 DUF654-domain-containing protein [Pseudovirgaria hyperparasitica]